MYIYKEHYDKVALLRDNFELVLDLIEQETDIEKQFKLAQFALTYFCYNATGYYVSGKLEKVFAKYADTIKTPLKNISCTKKSFLHVMTEAYETGGHTRVVERWIKFAPEDQKHSVVLLGQTNTNFKTLIENINEKKGFIYELGNRTFKKRIEELRLIAMQYEYIVLHTHMDDPTAVVAFAYNEFTRPILFYNHASHRPWVGKCISDLVLDIKSNDYVTEKLRHIGNNYFLGIPTEDITVKTFDKNKIRQELNIPLDKKIIVSSGDSSKYSKVIDGHNFIDYLFKILDDDTICFIIGVDKDLKDWSSVKNNKQIKLLGRIDFDKGFKQYLRAADLYLDSYPLGGGTACIDAISNGTPVLSLESAYSNLDYITESFGFCTSSKEYVEKAKKLLRSRELSLQLLNQQQSLLIKLLSKSVWCKKVESAMEKCPKIHQTYAVDDFNNIDDLSVLCNIMFNKKFLQSKIKKLSLDDFRKFYDYGYRYKHFTVPFIFQINSYIKDQAKTKELKFLCFKYVF